MCHSVSKGLFASQRDLHNFVAEDVRILSKLFAIALQQDRNHVGPVFTGNKLWWADDDSAQLGTASKRDGRNHMILRNKTNGVVHMKVYDREGQKGKAVCNSTRAVKV